MNYTFTLDSGREFDIRQVKSPYRLTCSTIGEGKEQKVFDEHCYIELYDGEIEVSFADVLKFKAFWEQFITPICNWDGNKYRIFIPKELPMEDYLPKLIDIRDSQDRWKFLCK